MGSSTRENVPESRSGMMNGCEEASSLIEGNRILILIKDDEEACRPYGTITILCNAFGHTRSKSSSACGHSPLKIDLQEQREQ